MIVKTYSVFCDAKRACAGNWIAETTDGAQAARREAANNGWMHFNKRDICPDCVAQARREHEARNARSVLG